jgi:hypothetical protein
LQTRRGKFGKMHRFLNSVIPQTISSEKNWNVWTTASEVHFVLSRSPLCVFSCQMCIRTYPFPHTSNCTLCCNSLFAGTSVNSVSIRRSMLVLRPNRRETCAFGENFLISTICLWWILLM